MQLKQDVDFKRRELPKRRGAIFAFLFAQVHTLNPGMSGLTMVFGLLNIFLASLMLGYCYLRSGSLALPVGVHLGWNWTQSALGFSGSGNAPKFGRRQQPDRHGRHAPSLRHIFLASLAKTQLNRFIFEVLIWIKLFSAPQH
ncbi:MAG TPA: hypothetical protein DCW29_07705 [Janthinobacterium sp.]|nr:hypothetical protein [Janthinobacterium sp.]